MFQRTFKAFQYPDFRLMWMGACTSSIGTWMQQVAQAWLVYKLSNSNPKMLALDTFLGQIPIVLFSLLGGVLADRKSRRHIILASQYIQMTCAFILAALFFMDVVQVWHILVLSFLTGLGQSFGGPAYSALIPSLVGKDDLPNAIALNSIQFNLARVIGPTIGGLALTYLGATWCFGLNGLSFVAVIGTLYAIRPAFTPSKQRVPLMESMKQGFTFIKERPGMVPLTGLAFLMTFLGFPLLQFMPVFADKVFQGGTTTYAALLVCSGAGSVVGALLIAWLGRMRNQGRNAVIALSVLGLLMIGFAKAPTLQIACLMTFLAGSALMAVFSMVASLVQLITPDEMRGRVMSVYNLAFRGGGPFGVLIAGALIPEFTAPWTIAGAGLCMMVLSAVYLSTQRKVTAL